MADQAAVHDRLSSARSRHSMPVADAFVAKDGFQYSYWMKLLAISGSTRAASTNTALLTALQHIAPPDLEIEVFHQIGELPVFSPDLEGDLTPECVREFFQKVQEAEGLLISSPEYVRSIPGGLKNAIDWLVSGEQIVQKPIALVHASHRGDDMLEDMRLVLATVSSNFNCGLFLRLPLMKETTESIRAIVNDPDVHPKATKFLLEFSEFCLCARRE